jgi:hypothetical protein
MMPSTSSYYIVNTNGNITEKKFIKMQRMIGSAENS